MRSGTKEVISLRDTLDVTVALAVWGTYGPTHIYVEEANRAIITKSQIGSVLPLLTSATGRVFAAFDDSPAVEAAIDREIAGQAGSVAERKRVRQEFDALCETTRASGLGQVQGDFYSGIIALSCPVFNHRNDMTGAITILSHQGDFDPSIDGPAADELKQSGLRLSRELGSH